jgi:RNA polymerase sigma-70 factor (family 1)
MKSYTKFSDFKLTELLKMGDEDALAEIFVRYHPLLLNFTYKKINDKEQSKDILQEVFTQLWMNRATFELNPSLSSYLYTLALNIIRNLYKHQKVKDKHIQHLKQIMEEVDRGEKADYLIREKDIQSLIEKEISALPQRSREVFILRRKAFLSNKEIAERMGLSEQTIETHMKHAIKKLRNRLGPTYLLIWLF